MAFKLHIPFMKIFKQDKIFNRISKNHYCYCINLLTSGQTACMFKSNHLNGYLQFRNNSSFKRSCRLLHQSSPLHGKIVSYKLSDIGEGIVEVVIKEWLIKAGDKISQFDPICEVQSDKASVTITSRYDGIVRKLCYEVDDTAKVGEPLIVIELLEDVAEEESSEKVMVSHTAHEKADVKEDQKIGEGDIVSKVLSSPAVRRLAKENNIDLRNIKGSGRAGQILKEDVLSYLNRVEESKLTKSSVESTEISSPSNDQEVIQEIKGIRKAMVKSMVASWKIPLFAYCDEVDVGELVSMKDDLKKIGQSKGIKITFMPFFIKAASLALTKYPIVNSSPDENCDRITFKSSHNIGVAIDSPHGLVVPSIKNVEKLGIIEIAKELNRLQEIAAKGQLGLEDLSGGTFTLSNIGIIGGTYMNPLLLPPQVIIGGIGRVRTLPRFDKQKNIFEAHVFNISWTADHRVLDGATVARFSNLWKQYIDHPQLLLNL